MWYPGHSGCQRKGWSHHLPATRVPPSGQSEMGQPGEWRQKTEALEAGTSPRPRATHCPPSSQPVWPTAASQGTRTGGGPGSVTSCRHPGGLSAGLQKGPLCSLFLRIEVRPKGPGQRPGQDCARYMEPGLHQDWLERPCHPPGCALWPWAGLQSQGDP